MFYLSLIGGLFLEIFFLGIYPDSVLPSNNKNEWKFVENKGEIAIYERWIEISDTHKTRERKGEFILDSHIETVFPIIHDEEEILKWMSSSSSVKIIEEKQNRWVSYIIFDAPWPFKKRDLVAEFHWHQRLKNGEIIVTVEAKPELLPENKDVIRIKSYMASWKIKEEGTHLKITFTALSDTPPVVPRWIQDPITQGLFWESLNNFRSVAHEKSYGIMDGQLQAELK